MATLDQSYTAGAASISWHTSTSDDALGQGFTPSLGNVGSVELRLKKFGSPTGNIYVEIQTDDGAGLPSNTVLGTSDSTNVATLTTSFQWITFTFATPVNLSAGTQYHIVVKDSGPTSGSNYPLAENATIGSYGDSGDWESISNNVGTWTAIGGGARDMNFREYAVSSVSPSASPSISPSISQSLSPSISPSISPSVSPSSSVSPSVSLSPSISPSVSPSVSLSPSISPSTSPSTSPSVSLSPSISPSVSPSVSVSPSSSVGWTNYTRGSSASLPSDDTDMGTSYSAQDIIDVSTSDNVRVSQAASIGDYTIHLFKDYISANAVNLQTEVQTNIAPSLSTVYLQIYNRNSGSWETVDSDNSSSANTDFILRGTMNSLTNYKDAGNVVACRVYQEAM